MQLGYGLYQQQTQKLVMTPQLRQAITILQYSSIELTEYLHNEIVDNPVFEIEEKELERFDFLYQNYHKKNKSTIHSDDEWSVWDTIASPEETLEEYLLEQARFLSLDRETYEVVKFLIGCLDEAGYLKITLYEVAEHFDLPLTKIESALDILQSFEPIGVGARDLQETLLIQLKHMEPINTQAVGMVTHYLKELGERKFSKIAQEMRITVHEVQQLADFIKTLNPRPASGFNGGIPKYIIPDVVVEQVEGEFIVIVNDTLVPRLKINPTYYQYVKDQSKQNETSKYIIDKYQSAKWLVKSIEQRRNTLYKVTNAIIQHQKDFFAKNLLRPLTLKEIADEIGVHESTVSRAINQKYVQTPIGIFELKYFFTTGLNTKDGESTSVENVKKIIQEMVDGEDKGKPLSDQKIADLLIEKGIKISRRTVAKYRDELAILPSSKRKRFE